jgi:hypothetical protein
MARRLADREGLRCDFRVANAFRLDHPTTLFTSTGVIHHFRGDDLDRFLGEQGRSGARAFAHFDTKPSWLAPVGSWLFHRTRILGPFTLTRPAVIAFAALVGVWPSRSAPAIALTAAACVAVLAAGAWLDRRYACRPLDA